jgi:hypothetical protein
MEAAEQPALPEGFVSALWSQDSEFPIETPSSQENIATGTHFERSNNHPYNLLLASILRNVCQNRNDVKLPSHFVSISIKHIMTPQTC